MKHTVPRWLGIPAVALGVAFWSWACAGDDPAPDPPPDREAAPAPAADPEPSPTYVPSDPSPTYVPPELPTVLAPATPAPPPAVPVVCDGEAYDTDGDGVADECAPPAPTAEVLPDPTWALEWADEVAPEPERTPGPEWTLEWEDEPTAEPTQEAAEVPVAEPEPTAAPVPPQPTAAPPAPTAAPPAPTPAPAPEPAPYQLGEDGWVVAEQNPVPGWMPVGDDPEWLGWIGACMDASSDPPDTAWQACSGEAAGMVAYAVEYGADHECVRAAAGPLGLGDWTLCPTAANPDPAGPLGWRDKCIGLSVGTGSAVLAEQVCDLLADSRQQMIASDERFFGSPLPGAILRCIEHGILKGAMATYGHPDTPPWVSYHIGCPPVPK